MIDNTPGMLSPYRVLDLSDEKGHLCGKLLGDLGADVIKVEKPSGDSARMIGPFFHDEIDPEKSLSWMAFNTNKRGITLDIEKAAGRQTLKKLIRAADVLIESYTPGYMNKLGLGYAALEKTNPGLVMVSISHFGQTGPYSSFKGSDMVDWALGGKMYLHGSLDRPPVRISNTSQSYLHAAAEAAAAAVIALNHREMTGEGQQVDVSAQECVAQIVPTYFWDMVKVNQRRGLDDYPNRTQAGMGACKDPDLHVRHTWSCKDGEISFFWFGGPRAMPMVALMTAEGFADEFLKGYDWNTFDYRRLDQATVDRLEAPTAQFFRAFTKAELLEKAAKGRVMLVPISTTPDIMKDIQLAARHFWVKLEHPELKTSITYPGAFAKLTLTPPVVSRRAPHIGEHNNEVMAELKSSRAIRRKTTPSVSRRPLEGVKILDFSWQWAGPITVKTMAEYGADVIKIEGSYKLGRFRTTGPFKDGIVGPNRSGNFQQYNSTKPCITLNTADRRGVEIAKRLAVWADVVVENFAGGVIDHMGLGYEALKRVKPDIIMLSASMQGQTGPFARQPGFGAHLSSLAGFNGITGWPDRMPEILGAYTDFVNPHFNVLALVAALDYHRRTGKGQYIDVSQLESSVYTLAPMMLDYAVNGRVAGRMGNKHPDAAPHNAYRCQGEDKWCAIAIFTDEEWQNLVKAMGNPAWANDHRFSTLQARKQNEEELDRLVESWTASRSASDVMHTLQSAGVAAGVLQTFEDLVEHDLQLAHRHFFHTPEHPFIGKEHIQRPPFLLSKSPCEVKRASLMGEYTIPVLKNVLGMSDGEIAALIRDGVAEGPTT